MAHDVDVLDPGHVTLDNTTATAGSGAPPAASVCTGVALDRNAALARFASGATRAPLGSLSVTSDKRTCNGVSGCGSWASSQSVPITGPSYDGGYVQRAGDVGFIPLPGAADPARAWFELALHMSPPASEAVRLHLSYAKGGQGLDIALPFDGSGDFDDDGTYGRHWSSAGTCTDVGCPNLQVGGLAAQMQAHFAWGAPVAHLVTNHCLRVEALAKLERSDSVVWDEYRVVFSSTY